MWAIQFSEHVLRWTGSGFDPDDTEPSPTLGLVVSSLSFLVAVLDHGFEVAGQPLHHNDDDATLEENGSYDEVARWLKAWNAALGALWR